MAWDWIEAAPWDAVAAVGTVGAALAAVTSAFVAARIAKHDRRNADQRAQDDRTAAVEIEATQREHDGLRYRLDHLLSIAEAFEAARALRALPHQPSQGTQAGEVERRQAEGVLRARLAASVESDAQLPTVTAIANDEAPSLAAITEVMNRHRDFLPEQLRDSDTPELQRHADEAARAELNGTISAVRRRLLGDFDSSTFHGSG